MTASPDLASCSAAASLLAGQARRLREADRDGADPLAIETADALDRLAAALSAFVTGVRDPRPSRPGRARPPTALRAALRELHTTLDPEQPR